jgi:hypothetical protein
MDWPPPVLIRSFQDAEVAARDWIRFWGFEDAELTGGGADGGVDVESLGLVAQVKAGMRAIGRPVVQQIYGVAASRGCEAAVFSLTGYTRAASQWADLNGVGLFHFDLQGEPAPINEAARRLSERSRSGSVSESSRLNDCLGEPSPALDDALPAEFEDPVPYQPPAYGITPEERERIRRAARKKFALLDLPPRQRARALRQMRKRAARELQRRVE